MNKLLSLALLPFLTVSIGAQPPATDKSPLTATERADREFLATLGPQEAAAAAPAPSPVAAAPAPAAVERSDATHPQPDPRITPAKAKPKTTVSSSRSRPAAELAVKRPRSSSDGPVYRGVLVEPPAVLSRIERKIRPVTRRLDAGPLRVIKITTTTVTRRASGDEDDD